jgi:predicted ATP-binding protein involved in virulence
MFLKEIYLKNYKCFEEKTFSFEKRFTVLIGDNGSGKTAALDGIAKAFSHFRKSVLMSSESRDLTYWFDHEIRQVSHKQGSKSSLEKQNDYQFKAKASLLDGEINWHMGQSGGSPSQMENYGNTLKYDVARGGNPTLPIFAYYQTQRRWSNEKHEKIELYPIGSRTDIYRDCLNIETSSKTLLEWFKRMAIIEFQRNKFPPELKAIQKAIIQALESLRPDKNGQVEAYFSAENDELMLDIGDGKEFPFRLLSEGYRNTLGLIADIAYRMAELNPHVTTDTPGVVLIDEIDLHLHPKWQRNIVGDLKRIFPNCQFIVTTHSPFIIQSLDVDDGIIRLDNEYEEVPEDFVNQSIEDIAEDMQGVENPQWSEKKTAMYEAAKEYFKTLEKLTVGKDDAQIQQLREELELISKPYASNIAYLAFLEQKRLVKEAQVTKGQQVVNDPEQQATYKKTKKTDEAR